MSYASERQTLREQRQQKNTTTTAGGVTPPATPTNTSSGESFASQRAKLREQRGNASISEKVKKRVEAIQLKQHSTSALDTFNNLARNTDRITTSGGYYSRPTLGSQSERLYGNITVLEPILTEKRTALDTAQTSLIQAETDLKTVQEHLDRARATYDADPTNENATSYNQIVGAYNLAYDAYASAFDAYSVAYNDYKPYEEQLVDALTAYQLYSNQQQSAFNAWRGTIRDTGAIETEMMELDARINQTEQEITNLKRLTRGRSDAFGQHMRESLQEAEASLQTMQQAKTLLLEEYDWSRYYRYNDLMQAADFAEKSRYATTANGLEPVLNKLSGMYTETGFNDLTYDYINRNQEAHNKAMVNSIGDNTALLGLDKSYLEKMTDDEIAIFNYLYATQGADAAYQYTAYLTGDLTRRQREKQEEKWKEYAEKDPLGSSVFSVMISPVKGLSYLGQFADYAADGQIDQNAAYNKFSYIPGSIRSEVVQQIEASGKWGKVGSFAYQTGLSMADFLLATALTGNNQALTLTIMGSGAAADATISAKDRGLSDNQAFALGTAAGILEGLIESVNMETVLKPDALKDGVIRYILKNAASEGTEEVATDIGNLIADVLIAGDQNVLQTSIDNHMKQGLTKGEAVARTFANQALQMMADFAGGAMSGGIMSGTNAVIHVNYTNRMGNELGELDLDEEDIQAFIETGLESDPETASYQLAVEMQAKIEAGETLSNYDLARLYQANMQAIQAEEEDAEDLRDDTATDDQTEAAAGDVTDPGGLQLPSLRNDTQTGKFVTQNAQNVTKAPVNDTAAPAGVPLSVAERLRQEQGLNGGTQYESNYERAAGSAVAEPAGELYVPGGASLPDGGRQRYDGASAPEQVGVLAGRARQAAPGDQARVHAARASVQRTNIGKNLRPEKVSSLDLGLQNGTEERNIQVIPREYWDEGMAAKAEQVLQETGKQVSYILGRMQVRNAKDDIIYVKGVNTGKRIIVQANNTQYTAEQIADHEAYHGMTDPDNYGQLLNDRIVERIQKTFSREEFDQVLGKYIDALSGIYDLGSARDGAEYEQRMNGIIEELLADAHAGMNMWGAGATKFTDTVNRFLDDNNISRKSEQDNGTEEPTGPPSDRYSFAGENANNADLDALARAKEMQAAGVADETIRQQTGWHTGMDGKWRWEIDDSAMRYDSSGDLRGAESAKWAMEDYESARDDLWGHADMGTLEKVRAYNRADIAGDDATKQELYDELINGQYAYYFDQYVEAMTRAQGARNAPAGGTLQDYIDHPALFEAYPQLRNVTLRFERMGGGMMGYFDRQNNEIVLNDELRYAAEDTLVHEIQHAIQKAEGFTRGSNEEYWRRRQDSDDAVRAYDAKIQDSEKKIDEIMRQLPENVAEQFRKWSAMDDSSQEAMMLMQELGEGPYGDLFNDYFMLTWSLDEMRNYNHKRGPLDLYRSTAGEIEARDVTARRNLTPEQRRSTEPARGDSYTVFMEDSDELSLQHGDRFSVEDDAYMEAVNNGDMKAAQRMVDAAAERWGAYLNNDEANEVFRQDGRVRTFYHGTNTGDFTKFDSRLLGSSSGDLGWFGKGFYFAFSHDEAATYGGRVIPAYLRMSNPYDYSRLYQFKGSDKGAAEYARFAWVYNITKQFPDIAEGQHVWAYPNDAEEGSAVSWKQLTTWMDQIQSKKQFSVEEVELNDGTTAWELRADPKKESFTTASGETFEWTEYGMTQIFATEQDAKEPINQIGAYLKNVMGVDSVPRRTIEKIDFSGALQRAGYDGILQSMSGDEAVVFSPEQIKTSEPVTYDDEGKVIPLSKRFSSRNPDIRYSVDDEGSQQAQEQKPAAPKKKIRPVAESRPLIAKKDLRNTVLNLFSIPNGQRAEVGAMIDSYADRLIKNGSLTEGDRKAFFDRMYDAGVMVMPAEEYSAFARSHIVDGRIYVSDSVKSDFGDDWADIRRRAFAAGVYLVNDRSASGIDQWNATLSVEDMLPGLFDSEETDERTILERILQVAEEGKDEHLSLAEYTRRLSQQEGISEDEFLDNMERQLDWALRTFAEKARLEVHLRDRTGRKIAQEREKGAERMTRQQAKEAQRRADERQARKDSARRAKERRELRELQQRTLKQLQWLSKNRNRAPEELQATWDEVLGDIDLYAISAADEMRWSDKHNATWKDLAQMYKDAMKNDPNFLPSKELERIVTRLDATKIADMDLGALQDLYKAAIGLRTEFYNRNNVINDEMQRLFAEVYTDAKREIESAPGGFTGGVADKFLNLDQLTPMNVLQRMAGWDPDGAFYSMAKQLERGERDMRAYSVKAQKMLQDFLTEHEDWVKKADGQGKDAIWYEVEVPQLLELGMGDKPIFGPTVKVYMTPAQKVHMFLESKNLDNLRHMTGGRTFVNKDLYSQGKRQEALSQGRTIKLAPETVRKLVSDLTPEEMELAQILDRYYNTFATQEINKVSNILYGYDKAMGKNYAPIYTNRNYTKTEFGVFDTTAEGVGNLKGRQYAVNPSYNISAFDAFGRHVDQTARFCGMAIPARNWTTLMNWREKNNSTGDVITHKWGEESKRYITDLITTLQAGDDAKSDTISSGLSELQSNYITAIFGANPSIVLKQLGSIPLAGAYLDARNMPTPAQISKIDRSLISKYTQELEWRTMGYATPETKQLKDNPNWTQTNKVFKFVFGGGAITAMDGWAASTLWPWAENKVRREHPELAVGTKAQIDAGESAFYKKVAEEFEIAVSRSQSVSDEIHQGTLRKSKNPITKAFTMFRSDSAQTYNALRQKIGEARYYMRTGAKEKVVQTAKKAAGTAFVAMLLNAAWSEAISFLMALWKNKGKYYRDDEDELTFQSVAGEMVSNMLGSYAGVVTGGEEVFELIGNIITGDKWYGIETPGMEQLNNIMDVIYESGSGMRDLVAGGWDILKNGGNLGEYFNEHSGQILGNIKDLAETAAMYLTGLPASNLEAYLIGTLKWLSPELGTAYDDLFSNVRKDDLSKLTGDALKTRIGSIMESRGMGDNQEVAQILADLYEAGYKTAVPSDIPTSVSANGENRKLSAYQQQFYSTVWREVVNDSLEEMMSSDRFVAADKESQAKMVDNLYDYAAGCAKTQLLDTYCEVSDAVAKISAMKMNGVAPSEYIVWKVTTSGLKTSEKMTILREWDMSEEAKKTIVGTIIGTDLETETGKPSQYAKFLSALEEGMTVDQYLSMRTDGVDVEDYLEATESGLDSDDALNLATAKSQLEPNAGAELVSDLQKWRASVDFSDDVEDQLTALSMVMDDYEFINVEIANNFGIAPDAYVRFYEIRSQYDADGSGGYKQVEIQTAIDAQFGHLSQRQKAALWQLMNSTTKSAKKNPYSKEVGQQVLDAKAAAKEAVGKDQDQAPVDGVNNDTFSQELLNQLLGRG